MHTTVSLNPNHSMEELGRSSFNTVSPHPRVMGVWLKAVMVIDRVLDLRSAYGMVGVLIIINR